MPRVKSQVRYVDHISERGVDFFRAACANDLEGTVAKWKHGVYQVGGSTTSWLKIKNLHYFTSRRAPRTIC